MADDSSLSADRGKHYRALAAILRARIPHAQSDIAFAELSQLAAHYESLAAYLDLHSSAEPDKT